MNPTVPVNSGADAQPPTPGSDSFPEIDEATYDDERDEAIDLRYSITSYGADYPVDGLVGRLKKDDIFIPTFQRQYIWQLPKASRFIESLLLGLPVPGIFLAREEDTKKLLVIDGQQRLKTLLYFYDGIFEPSKREFRLAGLKSKYDGATYKSLDEESRRRLDDSILHATIVRQDEPSDDNSSVYLIFERLNTGAVTLHPQELRACIFHGRFNALLADLNKNQDWRRVYGKINSRMRDQELILRFLALHYDHEEYTSPMKNFLNRFMKRNSELPGACSNDFTTVFSQTIAVAQRALGGIAFRPARAFNAAVFDAVMVGIAYRLRKGSIDDPRALRTDYDELLTGESFSEATTTGTTQEPKVRDRIRLAIDAFSDTT